VLETQKPKEHNQEELMKQQHQFQMMELDYQLDCSTKFEVEGENERTLLQKFLLHFLFVPHDSHQIELFEKATEHAASGSLSEASKPPEWIEEQKDVMPQFQRAKSVAPSAKYSGRKEKEGREETVQSRLQKQRGRTESFSRYGARELET